MNLTLNHGSATIYQFPVGGRAALQGRRHDEVMSAEGVDSHIGGVELGLGDSWYHEAAIQESNKTRDQ